MTGKKVHKSREKFTHATLLTCSTLGPTQLPFGLVFPQPSVCADFPAEKESEAEKGVVRIATGDMLVTAVWSSINAKSYDDDEASYFGCAMTRVPTAVISASKHPAV